MSTRFRLLAFRSQIGLAPAQHQSAPSSIANQCEALRGIEVSGVYKRSAPRAGQKMLTLGSGMPRQASARRPLRTDIGDFSLHAGVQARDRKRLEQLCRHWRRPGA